MKRYSSQFVDPVVLVTVATEKTANVMTVGWASPVSFEPPVLMVSIAPKRFTHDLLVKAGEFGVSVLADDQIELSTLAGTLSGSKTDKLAMEQFDTFAADKINAPLIRGARAWFECRLVSHHTVGDHTAFYGEVVGLAVDEDKSPLILFNRHYYGLGGELAAYP
ncbi:MAG: flavin reductase family protein [Candidatus Latescibacterota bacterium]